MIEVDSNIQQWAAQMNRLNAALKRDPKKALRTEARLLFQVVSQFTPPTDKAEGRAVVLRDLRRAVTPIKVQLFKEKSIRQLLRSGNLGLIQEFLDRQTGPLKGTNAVRFDPNVHNRLRDRLGRVTREHGNVTTDAKEWKAYLKQLRDRVGQARGGWVPAVQGLGGRSPQWATRWGDLGTFNDRLDSITDASLVANNNSAWAKRGRNNKTMNSAIRSRTTQLRTAVAAAVRGAAYKSLKG